MYERRTKSVAQNFKIHLHYDNYYIYFQKEVIYHTEAEGITVLQYCKQVRSIIPQFW